MNDFTALFTRAAKLMRSAADVAFSRHGVRLGQNLVIDALAETDGLTPGELAQRLHVTTPTIVKMAARMEAAGLVTKRRDAKDARLVRVYLTDRARGLRGLLDEERRRLQERATANLTPEERQQMEHGLAKMIRNLEEIAPPSEEEVP